MVEQDYVSELAHARAVYVPASERRLQGYLITVLRESVLSDAYYLNHLDGGSAARLDARATLAKIGFLSGYAALCGALGCPALPVQTF